LQLGVSEFNPRLYTSEDIINSVGMPMGDTPKCSFIVSLGLLA